APCGRLAEVLFHKFFRRTAVLVKMDVARWRGFFLVTRIKALAGRLARIEATGTILTRPLGAALFFGLLGAVGEAEALAGDFHGIGAAAGEAITGGLALKRSGFGHFAVEIDI